MSLPTTIRLFKGLDHDLTIVGPGAGTVDLDAYDEVRWRGAGLTKSTSDAAQAEIVGTDLLLHLLTSDLSAITTPLEDAWQVSGRLGSRWVPITDEARLLVVDAAT